MSKQESKEGLVEHMPDLHPPDSDVPTGSKTKTFTSFRTTRRKSANARTENSTKIGRKKRACPTTSCKRFWGHQNDTEYLSLAERMECFIKFCQPWAKFTLLKSCSMALVWRQTVWGPPFRLLEEEETGISLAG